MALAALGAAYELLDERSADRLEEELFRPRADARYGRAQRTHAAFADALRPARRARSRSRRPACRSQGVRGFLERAVESVDEAEDTLIDLQDSMRPVEVGDPELRAGLAEVRELVGDLRARSREFMRTFGR